MARQRLGPKAIRRMERKIGVKIDHVLVRGGTDHRYDVYVADGREISLWRDRRGEYFDHFDRPATEIFSSTL